jgi:hypothetical protein
MGAKRTRREAAESCRSALRSYGAEADIRFNVFD